MVIYEDKKLGAGAFGAVYLGRLRRDARKSLSTLEPYTRNASTEVAVKMLPGNQKIFKERV